MIGNPTTVHELESVAVAKTSERITEARLIRIPSKSWMRELCLLPAVALYLVLFLAPLVSLLWYGFWQVENYRAVPDFSLVNYQDIGRNLFSGARYALAMGQSLWVAVTTALLGTAYAYLIALAIVYGVPQERQRLVLLFAIAPFWSSYLLRLYAWRMVLSNDGFVNSLLDSIGLEGLRINVLYTQIATRVGLIHYLTPLLVIILYITVVNIDRSLIGAARDLGATRWRTFWKVIFPLSRFGLILAASFAMIVALGDFLSPALLGGGSGKSILGSAPTFPEMIMSTYMSSTNLPKTSALAAILVALMLIVLGLAFWAGNRSHWEKAK